MQSKYTTKKDNTYKNVKNSRIQTIRKTHGYR